MDLEVKSVTITLDEDLLERVDDTRHATTSRSEWVREAVASRLEKELSE